MFFVGILQRPPSTKLEETALIRFYLFGGKVALNRAG